MTYIAIEGPTGVGKTTLAVCLQERLGWQLLLDPYEANPFLAQYYRAAPSSEWTPLLVESAFVFLRLAQLRHARAVVTSGILSDYAFFRTRLYADLLPDGNDGERLKQMLSLWWDDVPQPDTIILLTASFDTLRSRVRRRGRPIERWLTDEHIRDLQRLYASAPEVIDNAEIIELGTDDWDPRRPRDLEILVRRLG